MSPGRTVRSLVLAAEAMPGTSMPAAPQHLAIPAGSVPVATASKTSTVFEPAKCRIADFRADERLVHGSPHRETRTRVHSLDGSEVFRANRVRWPARLEQRFSRTMAHLTVVAIQ